MSFLNTWNTYPARPKRIQNWFFEAFDEKEGKHKLWVFICNQWYVILFCWGSQSTSSLPSSGTDWRQGPLVSLYNLNNQCTDHGCFSGPLLSGLFQSSPSAYHNTNLPLFQHISQRLTWTQFTHPAWKGKLISKEWNKSTVKYIQISFTFMELFWG